MTQINDVGVFSTAVDPDDMCRRAFALRGRALSPAGAGREASSPLRIHTTEFLQPFSACFTSRDKTGKSESQIYTIPEPFLSVI